MSELQCIDLLICSSIALCAQAVTPMGYPIPGLPKCSLARVQHSAFTHLGHLWCRPGGVGDKTGKSTHPAVDVVLQAENTNPVVSAESRISRVDPEVVAFPTLDLNRLHWSRDDVTPIHRDHVQQMVVYGNPERVRHGAGN